ncbi:hypothetical protein ABB37_07901 [Leptomonas pyrrhocoris]|uniref:Uncharacterized protein n=1 Tax=Leptomonas pyrrhocoris TaxID=157538 RepID=A0A0N0DSM0_LEPPY|nr:hypothetical protein ABB37_07901 [Leptomonas pyrrhocoris]KPA76134.1 hypothetical protein ABB37_07901 [Leptomonas pyrrhocoris]|eukprot:XP_015654573.1 hypothetical protein ABB37_07901 [Leptomonas pyrrhocoris]
MSIVIVECAVLPEGVDFIEPNAVPLARPLRKILCAPNTLRFREAWYPLQYFCWCGPTETLGCSGGCNAMTDAAHEEEGAGRRRRSPATTEEEVEDADEGPASISLPGYTDYYLLCVSSICADLLRVRHRTPSSLSHHQHAQQAGASGPLHQPDVTAMMNAGYAVRAPPAAPPPPSSKAALSTKQGSADASRIAEEEEVIVSVVQRYVTHTDWCVYESRSRLLLSIRHTRPDVLKPISVHYEPCCCGVARGRTSDGLAGVPHWSSSSSRLPVSVSLCKWTELTLSETLCASLSLPGPRTSLPLDARTARLLHSVVGVFTVYGNTFVYHVPSARLHSQRPACMEVYLCLPDETGCSALFPPDAAAASSFPPPPPSSLLPSSAAALDPGHDGASPAELHGAMEGRSGSGRDGGVHRASPPASSPTDFFKRLTVAASSATASATPPQVRSGVFLKVARLSLRELLPPPPATFFSSSTSPFRGRAEARSPLAQPQPSSPLLSVQVWNGFLLLHSPRTGKSAVYDLAERSPGNARNGAEEGEMLSSRDYLLWATASERSRNWARSQRSRASSSSCLTSPNSLGPREGAAGGTHLAGSATTSGRASSCPRNHTGNDSRGSNVNPSDQLWSRAVAGDWTSMVTAVASSVMDLSSAVETITGATAAAADAQVPLVFPLSCGAATVEVTANPHHHDNSDEDRGSASSQRDDKGAVDNTHCTSVEVLYSSCVWPSSSRVPLVISEHDGSLRRCEMNVAALAEWLLLLRASSQTSPSSHLVDATSSGRSAAATAAAATRSADITGASSTSLGRLIAFACRHSSSSNLQDDDDDDEVDKADVLLLLLRELVAFIVLGEHRTPSPPRSPAAASQSAPGTVSSSSYSAVLQRHLYSAMAESPELLGSHWGALVEGLTLETELMNRCRSLARQRMLSPAMCGGGGGCTANCTPYSHRSTDDDRIGGINGTQLQSRLVTHVWTPVWRGLKYPDDLAGIEDGHEPHVQQQRQLERRRQRYEDVLCDYVRVLHRLAVPLLPALQALLLEVVLWSGSETALPPLREDTCSAAAASPAETCDTSVAALMARAGATARRVRGLLRHGVLEANCTTARSLLAWWGRLRCELASAQHDTKYTPGNSHAGLVKKDERQAREETATAATEEENAALRQPDFLSDGGCPEAEAVFDEAVGLFTLHGQQLEVVEAYRWRHDYAAAATVLLRLPRDTPSMELCEVHGAWRSLKCANPITADISPSSSSSSSAAAAAAAMSHNAKTTPRRTSRLLSWDTLAVAVLDGAWNTVRSAEEDCYVLVERAAAVARSASPLPTTTTTTATAADSAASSPNDTQVGASPTPSAWRLRAAERAVQAARRLYLFVATAILTTPGLTAAAAAAGAGASSPPPPPNAAVAATGNSAIEFRPTAAAAGEGGGGVRGSLARAPHPQLFNPISSSVAAGYRAHEVRYLRLRQQVEADRRHKKS